ncbi:protein kinase domain-containing protein [Tautonia sociabilis]|uniref:protein kinase domain-containing protein n=1 Tax=Tautonia sociabilis TaxID=2080755 RepID=UPI0013152D33|nr:redoxin domain-containing protein [Tautonia sociabilis]
MAGGATIGEPVPEFDLPAAVSGGEACRARLADYRGRWLALVFYPRDFSLVCPTELTALADRFDEFRRLGCEVLAVSCDDLESHRRWLESDPARGGIGPLPFPLASDEGGELSRALGVYQDPPGVALRGLFLVDPEGRIQYQVVHALGVGRNAEEVLRVLGALRSGGMCPSSWAPGDEVLDPTRVLGPGRVVGHYRIEGRLGEGSFSSVFLALDTTLQRRVALKVLRPRAAARPRAVLDEARTAAALNHPNICIIYSVDDAEGVPIIAMEYLDGTRLDRLMAAGGLPVPRAAAIAGQVASGMAAAHEAGVVHGDLKPQNILVDDADRAKIVDFGLARRIRPTVDPMETADGWGAHGSGLTGTPGYMAPEQTRGEPSSMASDVFALGCILFELLTGRRTVGGKNVLQVFEAIRTIRPEDLAAQVPPRFAPILLRALAPDPARRTISMREIAEMLASS